MKYKCYMNALLVCYSDCGENYNVWFVIFLVNSMRMYKRSESRSSVRRYSRYENKIVIVNGCVSEYVLPTILYVFY